ncbi:S-layer homology domain-containing protein [Megasphaera stantonii]|nr:S-layer homology domain-containing protein [Megasphaera stantonii]
MGAAGVSVGAAGVSVGAAEDAKEAATNAEESAKNAEESAKNAAGSATSAEESAKNAAGSATSAEESAKNAAGSATSAEESAKNAAGSATSAAQSAEYAKNLTDGVKEKIGIDENGEYKDITIVDKETKKPFDDLIGALNQTGAIVGDGELINGEKDLTKGINANTAAIAQNRQDINNLNHRVDSLDSRIDKVGAGAAALAALHPLDFDPDAKWDFAAGYGNYNGENAVAVGTFYRPNEDTMFSVGGTFGNGENMINAGVSLKIGAGSSHVTTSRTAMAKEIKSMRDIVAKQDAQIQKLTAMVNALVGVQTETDTTTMFPDVPGNHWAYEAVAAMAKSGLVKGYPDGEFKGDRNMTRYEFAQIVYNAIQAGAEVDARLVEEFKPELEYFHIATVAKDKDGNPTIERVRAN